MGVSPPPPKIGRGADEYVNDSHVADLDVTAGVVQAEDSLLRSRDALWGGVMHTCGQMSTHVGSGFRADRALEGGSGIPPRNPKSSKTKQPLDTVRKGRHEALNQKTVGGAGNEDSWGGKACRF